MTPSPPAAAPRPRRKRRWLRAPGRSLQITKSGWLFIGLTLLVGFAAINSGSNLLHAVFGAMLALIIGSGVLSEATVRRVRARRFVDGPLHARSLTPLTVAVTGTDPRGVLAVSVEDHDDHDDNDDQGGHCTPAFAVRVPGGGTVQITSSVVMHRRGPAKLPRAVVVTRFPFGLFIKRRTLGDGAAVLVYPHLRPGPEADLDAPAGGDDEGEKRRARAGEFFGLREYREGDDPRRIHWAAYARLSQPVVREMETGGLPARVLTVPDGAAGDPAFEDAIEAAASRAVALLARGAQVALRAGGRTLVPLGHGVAQRRRVLEAFARAGFAEETTPADVGAAVADDLNPAAGAVAS
ncbi:MAG: DUF58 domain-containing protein [Myxococcota bacterium]